MYAYAMSQAGKKQTLVHCARIMIREADYGKSEIATNGGMKIMLLLFFLVWLIFNGAVTTEIVLFGIVIAAVMFTFICRFMDYSIQKEITLLKLSGFLVVYVFQLIIEILRANLAVIRLILSQSEVAVPVMVSFRTTLKTKLSRVLLANSITLTPGTITVSLHDDELIVHCLDESMAEGMEDSIFVKMLEKMENMQKTERAGEKKWS